MPVPECKLISAASARSPRALQQDDTCGDQERKAKYSTCFAFSFSTLRVFGIRPEALLQVQEWKFMAFGRGVTVSIDRKRNEKD
jgi:hypothetical protein